ncbi:hypothetical protein BB558_005522, partial [Smittium angustum]
PDITVFVGYNQKGYGNVGIFEQLADNGKLKTTVHHTFERHLQEIRKARILNKQRKVEFYTKSVNIAPLFYYKHWDNNAESSQKQAKRFNTGSYTNNLFKGNNLEKLCLFYRQGSSYVGFNTPGTFNNSQFA